MPIKIFITMQYLAYLITGAGNGGGGGGGGGGAAGGGAPLLSASSVLIKLSYKSLATNKKGVLKTIIYKTAICMT